MKKRVYYFLGSIVLLPILLCVWLLIGGIFLMVPFLGLLKPDLFEKENKQ